MAFFSCFGRCKARSNSTRFSTDSEYESAEELDSPPHSSSQSEEAPQAPSTTVFTGAESATREEFVEGDSANTPSECPSDCQTDTGLLSNVVNGPTESDKTESQTDFVSLNGVETDAAETIPVTSETTTTNAPESVVDTELVTSGESEPSGSIVSESVLTLTRNEVVEESIVENTVLVDQQVIIATHTTPDTDQPLDVSDINLDLVTSGDTSNVDNCEAPIYASVDVNEVKESSDPAASSGESEHVLEPESAGNVTEEHSVSEATTNPEDTPHPPGEETTPIHHQQTEHLPQQNQETSQDPTSTPDTLTTEQHNTPEETNTPVATTPEHKEESPPPIPPPDPDDIPIVPSKGYNLDFLDNLDDSNFNPFASKTAIRNSPPPTPGPGCDLPPLKPAIKKKSKNTTKATTETNVEADTPDLSSVVKANESSPSPQDTSKVPEVQVEATDQKEKSSSLEISLDECDSPVKTPVKPLRKPPQRKPIGKTTPKPEVTEKNNNTVEKEDNKPFKEDDDLPIPPSKGYNLDFLDNLDDPNFNPFASKTAVRSSPPSEGAAFPASQTPPEKLEEPKPKVVIARKPSPKKGFKVPKKNSEVNSDSPKPSEVSVSEGDKKEEPLAVPETSKPEPSPAESPREEKEEELPLPKKGYNLDFLDDPNFDPFQSRSPIDKTQSGAKSTGVKEAGSAVIEDTSAKVVESQDEPDTVVNKVEVPVEETILEHPEPKPEPTPVIEPSEIYSDKDTAEPESQVLANGSLEYTQENTEPIIEPKNQLEQTTESCLTKDVNQTTNQNRGSSPLPDSENNWNTENTENTEPHLDTFKTPSIGTIGQLDSLEFDQLLEHEASRLAEEFMNCSKDSGLDDTSDNHYSSMDTHYSNIRHVDENVNPFHNRSLMANSPPLGKRGAVCGAESSESFGNPFMSRRTLKRDIVMGEERLVSVIR